MTDYPDLVVKIGTNWFIDIDDFEHNYKYGDGSRVIRFGPYPNEASARLAELAFLQGIHNELPKISEP